MIGSTMITATSGSISASNMLNVTSASLQSVSIDTNHAFSGVGLHAQLRATGTYSDATTGDVTNMAAWSSDTDSVVTIDPATGLTTGVSLGSATVSAAVGALTDHAPISITSNVWHPAAGLASSQHCNHTATLLTGGKVLLAGGICGTSRTTGIVEIYDPIENTWTTAASMSTARYSRTATLLANGKVLVAGGEYADPVTPGTPLASAEIYDPLADTWTSIASMSTSRAAPIAALLPNGKVLVAGGAASTGNLASAELYDPAAGTWSAAAGMATPRYSATATLLQNGIVLVVGGETIGLNAELYDPAANTWAATGSMSTVRVYHTTTLLANGKVLVTGGEATPALFLASTEIYDPAANAWTLASTMSANRLAHTATLLLNGTVLVAGGQSTDGYLDTAELYDPVADVWAPAGSMSTPRGYHTATQLQDGVVLVAGGVGLASCELYW
jgi:hypothetical protein